MGNKFCNGRNGFCAIRHNAGKEHATGTAEGKQKRKTRNSPVILSCRLRCCAGELLLAEDEEEAVKAAAEVEATTLPLPLLLVKRYGSDSSCESYSVSVLESSEELAKFSRSARSLSSTSMSLAES